MVWYNKGSFHHHDIFDISRACKFYQGSPLLKNLSKEGGLRGGLSEPFHED